MELPGIGAFVDTFLDGEKEGARRLMRHEMESMIDPLVESLFKQLKVKLVDYLDGSSDFHIQDQMVQYREMIANTQKNHSQTLHNANSIDANSLINSNDNPEHARILNIKQEIDDPSNVQLEPQLNDYLISSSSSPRARDHESSMFIESMIPSPSTGESLSNTDTMQQQPQPQQLANMKHNQFDEEECDCEKCVDGGIEVKEEEYDDSDQWIDEDQENGGSSRPLKRPRMDSAQPNNAQAEVTRQSLRQSTDEAQVNAVNDSVHKQNDQMENLGIEDRDNQSTIDHYDHGQYNFDESLAIQQNPNDTNNTIAGQIVDESITNPTQPNLVHSNGHLQCSDCPKSFVNKSLLRRHVRVHTGERPFACDQCGKAFRQKGHLTQHKLFHQNIKPFHCDQCDKQFVLKIQLYTHLRTHSGERPYKCRFCEMSFTESGSRKAHEQAKHHHVKPYRCKVCGLTAAVRPTVIQHIRIVHFGLPRSLKQQRERNIIDERDPRDLVEKV